jgi:hypothetical protein
MVRDESGTDIVRLIDRLKGSDTQMVRPVDAKSALNAKHTSSRTKLASHAQRAKDVPVNFS